MPNKITLMLSTICIRINLNASPSRFAFAINLSPFPGLAHLAPVHRPIQHQLPQHINLTLPKGVRHTHARDSDLRKRTPAQALAHLMPGARRRRGLALDLDLERVDVDVLDVVKGCQSGLVEPAL